MRTVNKIFYLFFTGIFLAFITSSNMNAFAQNSVENANFVEDEILIKFKSGTSELSSQSITTQHSLEHVSDFVLINVSLHHITDGTDVVSMCETLHNHPEIEYAEPNYILNAIGVPNDSLFNQLWGMNNTGQSGGTPDADIDAPEAWDTETGNGNVVVGVIDTGADYNHPDLAANIWTNPGEIAGNGIDDDLNGFVDDIRGWDFVNNDNDPFDDSVVGHGTHVSGTIGAVGNNGQGVAGVCWNVKIMPLKFLNAGGSGSTSGAINAILYATAKGADLTNNSWGGGGFSQALKDAIEASNSLFVAAAGNSGLNIDSSPQYPAAYNSANILSVASTDRNDNLSSFSNFGAISVDLGGPGSSIVSTVPGNAYATLSGTSMASPHAAGVAALVLSANPGLSFQDLKTTIMSSVDPIPALSLNTVSGGRLNVNNAISGGGGGTSNLIISPPTGTYIGTESIDFVVIFEDPNNVGVTGATFELNGNDIKAGFEGCMLKGTLLSGGKTYRCAGLNPGGGDIIIGVNDVNISFNLGDGSTISDSATWTVLPNTEP